MPQRRSRTRKPKRRKRQTRWTEALLSSQPPRYLRSCHPKDEEVELVRPAGASEHREASTSAADPYEAKAEAKAKPGRRRMQA